MKTIRVRDLKVGNVYRWAFKDPEELFLVLELPRFFSPVFPNNFKVISSKFARTTMCIFESDKFYEVAAIQ